MSAITPEYADAIEDLLYGWDRFAEAYQSFRSIMDRLDPDEARRFHAYVDADMGLGGFMGGPFLADRMESLRAKVTHHRDDGLCHDECWHKAVAEMGAVDLGSSSRLSTEG